MSTINIPISQDAFVRDGGFANTNYGNEPGLTVRGAAPDTLYSYLYGDLTGNIPSGATITSATLNLSAWFGNAATVYAVPVDSSWSEGTITWNNRPAIGSTASYPSANIPANPAQGTMFSFDVTKIVREHMSGARTTYGIALIPAPSSEFNFQSRNTTLGGQTPYITVTYNRAPNAPTIANPPAIIATKQPSITWFFSDPDGDVQGSYLVELVNAAYTAVLWSSGWLSGTANNVTIPAGVITSDGTYYARVRVMDPSGVLNLANGDAPDPSFANKSFLIDTTKAADPNPTVVYGTTTATISWNAFNDPAPSSGRLTTDFYLGQWNGTSYTNLLFNGVDIGDVTSKTVTGLVPGARYRYTVTYHDKAGNESLYTYKEFITKKQVGEDHIKNNAGQVVVVPLYDPASGVLGNKAYRKALNNGVVGCYELVPVNDPNAAHIHVQTSTGIMSLSK